MIKAAIVGAGAIVHAHLSALSVLDEVEIVGVCDLSAIRAEAIAERYGARGWYTDYHEMFASAKPDVVHVLTPGSMHFKIACDAIDIGAHVVIEKPIVSTQAELDELFSRANARDVTVIENHNYRYNPVVTRMEDMVANGDFGEVVHVDVTGIMDLTTPGGRFADTNIPHPLRGKPGGVIGDFLSHHCYLTLVFAGEHRKVSSLWENRSGSENVDHDEFRCLLQCERATGSMAFSSHERPEGYWVTVRGTRARATVNIWEPPWMVVSRQRGEHGPIQKVIDGLSEAAETGWSTITSLVDKLSGGPGAYIGVQELMRLHYGAIAGKGTLPISQQEVQATFTMYADVIAEENRL